MFSRFGIGVKSKTSESSDVSVEAQLLKLGSTLVEDVAVLNENVRIVCRHLGTPMHLRADQALGSLVALHASRMLSTVWTVILQQLRETTDHRAQLTLLQHFSNVAHRIAIPQRADAFKVFGKMVLSIAGSDEVICDKKFVVVCEACFIALGVHAEPELCAALFEKFFTGISQWSRPDARRTGSSMCAIMVRWTSCCGSFADLLQRAEQHALVLGYVLDSSVAPMWDHATILTPAPQCYFTVDAAKHVAEVALLSHLRQTKLDMLLVPLLCSSHARLKQLCGSEPWAHDTSIVGEIIRLLENGDGVKPVMMCPMLNVLEATLNSSNTERSTIAAAIGILGGLCRSADPMVAAEAYSCLGQCLLLRNEQLGAADTFVVDALLFHHHSLHTERCNIRTRGALVFFAKTLRLTTQAADVLHRILHAHLDNSNPVNLVPTIQCQVLHILGQTVNAPVRGSLQYIATCLQDGNSKVRDEAVRNFVNLLELGHFDAGQLLHPTQHSIDFVEGAMWTAATHRPRVADGAHRVSRNASIAMQYLYDLITSGDVSDGKDSASRTVALASTVQAIAPLVPASVLQPTFAAVLLAQLGQLGVATALQVDTITAVLDAARGCVASCGPCWDVFAHRELFSTAWTLLHHCCFSMDPITTPSLPQQPSLILHPVDLHSSIREAVSNSAKSAMSTSAPPEGSAFFELTQACTRLLTTLIDAGSRSSVFLAHMRIQYRVVLAVLEVTSSQHPVAALQCVSALFRAMFVIDDAPNALVMDSSVAAVQREKFVRCAVPVLNQTLAFDLIIVGEELFRLIELFVRSDIALNECVCFRALDPAFALFKRMYAIMLDRKFYNAVSGPLVMKHIAAPLSTLLLHSPYAVELAAFCTDDAISTLQGLVDTANSTIRSECFTECLTRFDAFAVDKPVPCGAVERWTEQQRATVVSMLSDHTPDERMSAALTALLTAVFECDTRSSDCDHAFVVECFFAYFSNINVASEQKNEVFEELLGVNTCLSAICQFAWDDSVIATVATRFLFERPHRPATAALALQLACTIGSAGAVSPTSCAPLPPLVLPSASCSDIACPLAAAVRMIEVYPGVVECDDWPSWLGVPTALKAVLNAVLSVPGTPIPRACLRISAFWVYCAHHVDPVLDCPFTEGEEEPDEEISAAVVAIGLLTTLQEAVKVLHVAEVLLGALDFHDWLPKLLSKGAAVWPIATLTACSLWAEEEFADDSVLEVASAAVRSARGYGIHQLDAVPFKGAAILRLDDTSSSSNDVTIDDDTFEQMCIEALTQDASVASLFDVFARSPLTARRLVVLARVVTVRRSSCTFSMSDERFVEFCRSIRSALRADLHQDTCLQFAAVKLVSAALPLDRLNLLVTAGLDDTVGAAAASVLCAALEVPDEFTPQDLAQYCVGILLRSTSLSEGIRESMLWIALRLCQKFVWHAISSGQLCNTTDLPCVKFLCKMHQTVGFSSELIQQVHAHYTPLLISFAQQSDIHLDEQRMVLFLATTMLLHINISEERHTKPRVHVSLTDDLSCFLDFPLEQMCTPAARIVRSVTQRHLFPSFLTHAPLRHEMNWNMHSRLQLAAIGERTVMLPGTWEKSYVSLLHMYMHVVTHVLQSADKVPPQSVADVLTSLQLLSTANARLLKHSPAQEGTAATTILQCLYAWYGKNHAAAVASVESRVLSGDVVDFRGSIFPQPSSSLDFLDWTAIISFTNITCSLAVRGSELLPGAVDVGFVIDKLLSVDVFTNQSCHSAALVMAGSGARRDIAQVAPLLSKRLVQDIQRYTNTVLSCSFGILQLLRTAFVLMQALSGEGSVLKSCQRVCDAIIACNVGGRRVQYYAHFLLQSICSMHEIGDEHWELLRWSRASDSRGPGPAPSDARTNASFTSPLLSLQRQPSSSQQQQQGLARDKTLFDDRGALDSITMAIQEKVASWKQAGRPDDHLPLRLSRRQGRNSSRRGNLSTVASLLRLSSLAVVISRCAHGNSAGNDVDANAERSRVEILSLVQDLPSTLDAKAISVTQIVYTVACEVLSDNDALFVFLNKFDFSPTSLVLFSQHVSRSLVHCDAAPSRMTQLGLFFDTSIRREQHEGNCWWALANVIAGLCVESRPTVACALCHVLWSPLHIDVATAIVKFLVRALAEHATARAELRLTLKAFEQSARQANSASALSVIATARHLVDAPK